MKHNQFRAAVSKTLAAVTLLVVVTVMLVSGAWAQSTFQVLYKFPPGKNGGQPFGTLVFDQAGNLYGTIYDNGPSGGGYVFKLAPSSDGTWAESVLHKFSYLRERTWSGFGAYAGLIFDTAGNLYGTTVAGGNLSDCSGLGCGVVFKLIPNQDGSWREKVLKRFTGGNDGANPYAGLIFDTAGNLYGTTVAGGHAWACDGLGCGVVFQLIPNQDGSWTEKVLKRFEGGRDGGNPYAGLIFDLAGQNLYGTTYLGGADDGGTVFRVGTWCCSSHSVLYKLHCGSGGCRPLTGVILDAAGNLYGTTSAGGLLSNAGTVFKLTLGADGKWGEQVLHSAVWYRVESLIFDAAGNLYGTAVWDSSEKKSLVFEITP